MKVTRSQSRILNAAVRIGSTDARKLAKVLNLPAKAVERDLTDLATRYGTSETGILLLWAGAK